MQELMRELIMQGMQRLPERPLQAETAEVLRPQPQQERRHCRVMRRNRPDLRFILAGLYGRVLCQQQM